MSVSMAGILEDKEKTGPVFYSTLGGGDEVNQLGMLQSQSSRPTDYFFLLATVNNPTKPEPSNNMLAGSGIGEALTSSQPIEPA